MASTAVAQEEWASVSSPTGNTIYSVNHTANGPAACGVGGEIHHRRSGKWKTVVKRGPSKNSRTLTDSDPTDDGKRLWVVGNSGAIGEYVVDDKELEDHSNPLGISSEFTSVSVTGSRGSERIYIGKSSGEVLVGVRNSDGTFDWSRTDTGSGYTVNAVDFTLSPQDGFAATNGGGVYRTRDGGDSWTRVGIEEAATGYTALLVDPGSPNQVYVGGGGGRIWRLDCDCNVWTPTEADTKRVYALEANSQQERYLGAGGSGRSYELAEDGAGWVAIETPTGNALYGAASADDGSGIDVLVGGSGTILER